MPTVTTYLGSCCCGNTTEDSVCCPGTPLPTSLTITVTGDCLANGTYTFDWFADTPSGYPTPYNKPGWYSPLFPTCGGAFAYFAWLSDEAPCSMRLAEGGFDLQNPTPEPGYSCSPLMFTYVYGSGFFGGPSCCIGKSVTVVVTP